MVPDEALASDMRWIVSAVSALSRALMDNWIERVLRSTLTIMASMLSPAFSTVVASSTRPDGDLGSAQIAFDIHGQRHHGALGLDRFDRAGNDRALVMGCDEVVERVAFQLLDTQRDAFLVGVDAQDHGFDFVALLEVAHRFFAGFRPGQVRQVHQAIDAARQADEHAEVRDGLDRAAGPCRHA